jgi:hypothetical protein
MEHLAGPVLDSGGGPIPNAKILLFDSSGTEVERLQSDSRGKFLSPHNLAGTYQLLVRAPGFTPLHGTLRVDPTRHATRRSDFTIHLGFGVSCSAADIDDP